MFLIILMVIMGVGAVCAGVIAITNRKNALSKQDRQELDGLRLLVDKIDELAYSQREINPELSVQIIDEIRLHNRNQRKELP